MFKGMVPPGLFQARPNGNAANARLFGQWFKLRSGEHGDGARGESRPIRFRTANLKLCSQLRYHSTGV